MTVAEFLIERLVNAGLKHIFGVPGDYVIDFYKKLSDSKDIQLISNTDENHSGFAADAYARVNGLGCAVVTYSVGASKVINAVQCAYAERSPLIIISGAPGVSERKEGFLLYHMVNHFNSQKKIFDEITCSSIVLDDPSTAGYLIDQSFESLKYFKRPIYIELPRDIAKKSISYDVYKVGTPQHPETDSDNLDEAIKDAEKFISEAERPVILAGVEIARYDLGEQMVKFAENNNIPITTTMLGKSLVNEKNDLFAGVYLGEGSHEHTKKIIEQSDCLLVFGDYHHDISLCFRPVRLDKRQSIRANVENLKIKNHNYPDIRFVDFCKKLFSFKCDNKKNNQNLPLKKSSVFELKSGENITSDRLFEKVNSIIKKGMAVCADIGDSLFGAINLDLHHTDYFLSPAFYASMGTAIPYALGVQVSFPNIRPIVFVGDGSFQMSCNELSTIVDLGLNPIIFILNNKGYTTERTILDGPFNDIRHWNYEKITELINGGKTGTIQTEDDLDNVISKALDSKELFVINVVLDKNDKSQGLKRVAKIS